jgi:UTP--glucose-1-phosphate uridylyltransferase
MRVTKAIIPVAGWGTRWLPLTKSIEKCMLPIGNRPLIDYTVHDCIKAGITELIFVVGENSTQLENYYRSNIQLNDYLRRSGNQDKLSLVAPLKDVKLHFITQPSHGKYGTAVPVALAADYVSSGESVVVVMGDDFFFNTDGSSEMQRLIDSTPEGASGILGAVLPESDTVTGRYGSIEVDGTDNLIRVTEHPDVLPSPFIKNVSTYLLGPNFLESIKQYVKNDQQTSGEYYIFTPFESLLARGETMKLTRAEGMYLDAGDPQSWLRANQVVMGTGA